MVAEKVTPISKGQRRFTTRAKVPRGESEFVGFRCAISRIRQMDEIVAARVHAELKTRSDILQDAVVYWLDNFYEENPSAPGRRQWEMDKVETARNRRDAEYEQALRLVKRAIQEEDGPFLIETLPSLRRLERLFIEEKCSPVEQKQIKDLVSEAADGARRYK